MNLYPGVCLQRSRGYRERCPRLIPGKGEAMEPEVLLSVNKGVAIITLNRPEKHNAINQALLRILFDCIETVARDEGIRVAILTGNGKSFCSGIDLDAVKTDNLFDVRGDGLDFPDIIGACRKPIIGAVNGNAITGGLEIALNCDFLIASERAVFGDTHGRVGIHPGWGMTQLLQEAIGRRRALQMSLSYQFIDAATACSWGLVNEVVAHEKLLSRTMEIAENIALSDPAMIDTMKTLIENRSRSTLKESLSYERTEFRRFLRESWESRSSGGAE